MRELSIVEPRSKTETHYTSRLKCFIGKNGELIPDEVLIFSDSVFNPENWEKSCKGGERHQSGGDQGNTVDDVDGIVVDEVDVEGIGEPRKFDSGRNSALARSRVRDRILGDGRFNLFVTLTLSPEMVDDRADWDVVIRRIRCWLDNRVRRKGLIYVLVPERHHASNGIHFHGFVNSDAVTMTPSGHCHKKTGRTIYNVTDWKYGFTTAVKLGTGEDDRLKSCNYVLKYITKSSEKVGGRWFLSGGDIRRPVYFYANLDFTDDADVIGVTRNLAFQHFYAREIAPDIVNRFTKLTDSRV